MASTATAAPRGGARVHVQKFGTFLSNMVLPNIGAFIAWGLITALFIQVGWITLIGDKMFGYEPGLEEGQYDYGFVSALGGWNGDGRRHRRPDDHLPAADPDRLHRRPDDVQRQHPRRRRRRDRHDGCDRRRRACRCSWAR